MRKQSFVTAHKTIHIVTTNHGEGLDRLLSSPTFSNAKPVFAEQVHGSVVTVVNNSTKEPLPGADGLITNNPNLSLVIHHADCLPIVFWHDTGVFGALHAGRKSTEAGIVKNALKILSDTFAITKDMHFWFGPAICKKCYQIDEKTDTHFDLRTQNHEQIKQWDINKTSTIHDCEICTKCQSSDFYSYRADGPGFPMNFTSVNAGAKS